MRETKFFYYAEPPTVVPLFKNTVRQSQPITWGYASANVLRKQENFTRLHDHDVSFSTGYSKRLTRRVENSESTRGKRCVTRARYLRNHYSRDYIPCTHFVSYIF